MKKKKARALVLLSGGLDSRLTLKILQDQLGEKNVEAVFFILPFDGSCCSDRYCVFKFAQKHNVKLHILDCTKGKLFKEYMQIVKEPKYSRGKALNPCIDCHLFMLKKAKKLAKKKEIGIIATGEVLGERPLSQRKKPMLEIEKEAGLEGKLLRPLSAKLLPETEAEKKGFVKREKLFAIQGRSRKKQIELAERYEIDYPNPAGGCLLTCKGFADKVKDLFEYEKEITMKDIDLLKIGRHFRYKENKIIVGRDEKENKKLLKTKEKEDYCFEVPKTGSPITILKGPKIKDAIKIAAKLTLRYSDVGSNGEIVVKYGGKEMNKEIKVETIKENQLKKLRITE